MGRKFLSIVSDSVLLQAFALAPVSIVVKTLKQDDPLCLRWTGRAQHLACVPGSDKPRTCVQSIEVGFGVGVVIRQHAEV